MLKTDKICDDCDGEIVLQDDVGTCLDCGKEFDEDELEELKL